MHSFRVFFFCECSHTATRVWQLSKIYKYFIYILNMWCCITLAQLKPRSSSEKLKFRIQTDQGGTDICHMTKNVSVPYCGFLLRCVQRRFSTGFNVLKIMFKNIYLSVKCFESAEVSSGSISWPFWTHLCLPRSCQLLEYCSNLGTASLSTHHAWCIGSCKSSASSLWL